MAKNNSESKEQDSFFLAVLVWDSPSDEFIAFCTKKTSMNMLTAWKLSCVSSVHLSTCLLSWNIWPEVLELV